MSSGDEATERALQAVETKLSEKLERARQRDRALRDELEHTLSEVLAAYRLVRTRRHLPDSVVASETEMSAMLQALVDSSHEPSTFVAMVARHHGVDDDSLRLTGPLAASRIGA